MAAWPLLLVWLKLMHHKETRAEGELNVAQHVLMWLSLSYAWGVSYVQNPGGRGVLVRVLFTLSAGRLHASPSFALALRKASNAASLVYWCRQLFMASLCSRQRNTTIRPFVFAHSAKALIFSSQFLRADKLSSCPTRPSATRTHNQFIQNARTALLRCGYFFLWWLFLNF